MRPLTVLLPLFLLAAPLLADSPDLTKLDRKIAKEPAYMGKPLYGLLLIGAEQQTKVWLVLDQSKAGGPYDLLYADLNGNGDLTESQERITDTGEFRLPNFKDPASGVNHTDFRVRLTGDGDKRTVMIKLKWRDQRRMGGGYPQDPETGYLQFADSTAQAPVLCANGDGPFRFQRWYSGKLTIGGNDDFKVFVGQQGRGPNSFWAFQEHCLPEGEGVQATLVYTDAAGAQKKEVCQLMNKC
jgi:hypothetical protein